MSGKRLLKNVLAHTGTQNKVRIYKTSVSTRNKVYQAQRLMSFTYMLCTPLPLCVCVCRCRRRGRCGDSEPWREVLAGKKTGPMSATPCSQEVDYSVTPSHPLLPLPQITTFTPLWMTTPLIRQRGEGRGQRDTGHVSCSNRKRMTPQGI